MKKKIKKVGGAVSLFDHVNHIKQVQNPAYFSTLDDVDKKTFSNYMISRCLSMNPDYVELINYLQKYQVILSPETFYRLCIGFIPKRKTFDKYIKNTGQKSKKERFFINLTSKHFEISKREADDYLIILSKLGKADEFLMDLCRKYGMNLGEELEKAKEY